jgi:hypothetical protein
MRGLALLVAVTIAGELIAGACPAVARAEAACDLISAQGVAAIVGGPMENLTTPGSSDSLCTFSSVISKVEQPQIAWIVTVALFTPRTMRQQGVSRAMGAIGGCRNATQCKKVVQAMKDGSPGELYDAQTPGSSSPCRNARLSCFFTNPGRASIVWAKHGDAVVAILAYIGAASPGATGASTSTEASRASSALTKELGLLNDISLRL